MAFDGITHEVTLIGRLYRGYNISPLGSFLGLVWGLFHALIGGAIAAWLYDVIAARFEKKEEWSDCVEQDGWRRRPRRRASSAPVGRS